MTATRPSLLLYAMPALPLAFLGLPLYVYLPAHYAAFPGIGLAAVGVVLLLARLIDLVTDPLVGLLADRSRHWLSPQWLMTVGGVLMLGGAWWLFRPAEDADALLSVRRCLTITYLGWTLLAIPYYALGAELGAEQRSDPGRGLARGRHDQRDPAALLLPVVLTATDNLAFSASALLWLVPPALAAGWLIRPRCRGQAAGVRGKSACHVARDQPGVTPGLVDSSAEHTRRRNRGDPVSCFTRATSLALDEGSAGLLSAGLFRRGLLALPLWVVYARRIGEARTWRAAMLLAAAGFSAGGLARPGRRHDLRPVCVSPGQPWVQTSRCRRRSRRASWSMNRNGCPGPAAVRCSACGVWRASSRWPCRPVWRCRCWRGCRRPRPGRPQAVVVPWLYAGLPAFIKLLAVLALQRSVLMSTSVGDPATHSEEVPDAHHPSVAVDPAVGASRRV